jgi:hypothetical protein
MTEFLINLSPYFTFGLIALSLLFKLHKRSVSTFITIVMSGVIVNMFYYGMSECATAIFIIFLIVIFFRAMIKPENDTFIVRKYRGEERRGDTRCH